ncbi:hypothetical protein Hte_011166 [Hypoxylon texense]
MDSQGGGNTGDASQTRSGDADDTQQRSNFVESQAARIDAVPKSHGDQDMAGLLEELRMVQEKLSDIDKRTTSDLEKSQAAKFVLNGLSEQNMFDSFLLGLKEQDPPSRVALDLRKTAAEVYMDVVNNSEDMNSLQKYIRYDMTRLDYKFNQESYAARLLHFQLISRYKDLFGTNKTETKNATEDVVQPKLNYVGWISFKACGEGPETTSFVIDVLVGEPILSDSAFSSAYVHRRKPTTFQEEQKPKESEILGQPPLPERIRIHSSVLLTLLSKIHGATISKKGGAVVMVRPFKALSFYQIQLRDWYTKLQNKYTPTTGSKETSPEDIAPGTASRDGTSLPQPTEAKTDNPSSGVDNIESNLHGSPKEESDGKPDGVASQGKDDDVTMSLAAFTHLGCLLGFMDATIVEKQKYLEEHCKKVSFVDLWHLFKPGVEVIEPGDKYMQCYRVVKVTTPKHKVIPRYFYAFSRNKGKTETMASIHCVYVDFDGRLLGPVSKRFDISRFEGQKDVTSLPVYPLSLAKNKAAAKQTLVERGERFLKVIQVGHMHYSGFTLESRDEVDSQVVVDFAEALNERREDERKKKWKPKVQLRLGLEQGRAVDEKRRRDDSDDEEEDDDNQGEDCDAECCNEDDVHNDSYVDRKQNERFLTDMLADTDDEDSPTSLAVAARVLQQDKAIPVTDDDKLIMSYRVFGFVLRSRSWAKLDLNGLMDLEEYRRKREKENPTENANENAFDNLVFPADGLDRKTIVRSLVAQHFRDKESGIGREEQSDIVRGKGDLGTTAREVEVALETNFALANKWGSILLLDEANRNLVVDEDTITNFVTDYWYKHPKARWNGRQIRNACQTALALAEFEAQGNGEESARNPNAKVCLGVKHIETVADAYREFMKYLEEVRDADQKKYAYLMGIRAKGMSPEDILANDPSGPFRRGQTSRLAEHRAQYTAKYSRPEQASYQQSYGAGYGSNQPDRQSHWREGSIGGSPGSPYQQYSAQQQRVPPAQRPLEPQPQRGWNPGNMGSYYGGEQDTQQQQGPPPSQESFHAGGQFGQHLQP